MSNIEKNKNYTIEITGMTHEGQGVGRIEGMAVFVDGALEGEIIGARIIKLSKTYAVGKLLSVLKPSPHRVEPFCSAYRRCGGCNLQHMDYAAQLAFKSKLMRDNLERIGGLKNVPVHETIGMQKPMHYRNKAQYPVAMVNGNVMTGFYAARSHEVINTEECGIQDAISDEARKVVRRFILEKGIRPYDETTGTGLLRHIVTRVGFNTGEVMVVLVINGNKLPFAQELIRRLTAVGGAQTDTAVQMDAMAQTDTEVQQYITAQQDTPAHADSAVSQSIPETSAPPFVKSIYLNINTENTNVVLGNKNILLYGSETITDAIGKYRFLISPHSFFQVNPVQTEVLYSKALEYAALKGHETVFDLYCGIGTISLFLSAKAGKVYGVEIVDAAIDDARKNALLNGVANVEFIAGESEKVVPELYARGVHADVVVLDPPRKGCEESLLRLLSEMQPERIVYVSCNPSTLARDLKYLCEHGYRAVEAQPVDMFPWTSHVESIVLMTNCGLKDK